MRELAELITDPAVSAFLDILPHHDTVVVICTGLGERRFTTSQLAPLTAMHNALPALLDAWEMVQKLVEWAKTPSGIQSAVTLGGYQYAQFDVEKMIRQWRDAQKNEGVE